MIVTGRLAGGEQLARRLGQWAGTLRRALAPALLTGAGIIADEARRLAPAKTGRLKRGIVVAPLPDAAAPAVEIQSQAPYSRFIEFGARGKPARPFLLPAALTFGRVASRVIADILRERNE